MLPEALSSAPAVRPRTGSPARPDRDLHRAENRLARVESCLSCGCPEGELKCQENIRHSQCQLLARLDIPGSHNRKNRQSLASFQLPSYDQSRRFVLARFVMKDSLSVLFAQGGGTIAAGVILGIIVAALFIGLFLILVLVYGSLWFQAYMSNARVSLFSLVGMS